MKLTATAIGVLASLVLLMCLSACGTTGTGESSTTMTSDDAADVEAQLRAKPALESARTEYKAAVTEMAARIAALTPGTTWQLSQDTWVGCGGEYSRTKAKQAYVMAAFTGPIPDAVWPQALQIVKDGAAALGATEYGAFHDDPGNHDVYLAGADGVEFRLGTQGAATLTGQSDCRLSDADLH